EGAVLAVIIVMLFLRDFRATIIAAVSLPLSIFPAFWVMDILGFSLNLVSFLAITLSTGILVDDAIVEIENIVRHMRMGKSPYRAALEAADEIGLAVIAISLTIIAIFAPASFMSGIAGQFFKQFGITVSVQVFFSLLAARFVTPMLAAYFMKDSHHEDPPPGFILRNYHKLVTWSVRHYFITILVGFGVFAASIWSITLLPQGFLPAQDTARSLLALELPPGTQLAYTEKVTEEIVARLRKRPEVKNIFVDGGRVPPGTQEVRRAALIINYTPKGDRKITQRELELSISNELVNIPDIRFWFLDENGLRAISLVVTGIDSNIVNNVASELATQMKRVPTIANVISETSLDRPELRIRPRAELAARLGVSTESLSQTIRVATIGDVGPALAKFDAGDRQIPIRVQLEDSARGDLSMLQQLRVPLGQRGERGGVPLSVVADIQLDQGPTSINRYDRERQATVAADLVGNSALGDATKAIYDLPVMKSLPKGVKVSPSGDAESLNELSEGFATAITAGLMMVYAVLVLLFGTFLQPLTILFSLPLSIGGAVGALLLTGKQLTTPVWIGILMLMGIVTKNAIMLVEFAIEAIRDGKSREEAMIDAGQKRARPIVMTTIAMVAGMMPSALAFGAGGEFRSPMALAVIGGLIFSTVLSLIFVPAMFMMMDDVGRFIWRFGKMLLSHHHDDDDVDTKPSPAAAAATVSAAPAPASLEPAKKAPFWRSK
ncbi:MAG: efflux RND transporter permease subunit, partial [Rhodopseudomonas palustris]|nr:efflux RND transporter permease subunit [Rhodopseudomonas palustris]